MNLDYLITECSRLQDVLENFDLEDLEPVVHLSYSEAVDIYQDMDPETFYGIEAPVPGDFWVDCYGIRLFVERIDG